MEIIEAKKLIHKETKIVSYFKIPRGKSWWDVCYRISQDVNSVYGWLEPFEVSDCYLLEANDGVLFELNSVYTEN